MYVQIFLEILRTQTGYITLGQGSGERASMVLANSWLRLERWDFPWEIPQVPRLCSSLTV